jgi:capsular polysaccharide biosynthesis protein
MQSSRDARKNFIDILSEAAEQQAPRVQARSLTNRVLAFIASLWPRSRRAE